MKTIKLCLAIMGAVVLSFGLSTATLAFHDGGVAHCDGCHTMHNSADNPAESISGEPGNYLTKGSDPSSTCLICHQNDTGGSYHVLSPDGSNMTPGGDFYWLTKTFSWTQRGSTVTRHGYSFGHSIIARDFGPDFQNQDPVLSQAPGGTFPSGDLGCTSCHDPHGVKANKTLPISGSGSYGNSPDPGTVLGNYRLLGDVGYGPANNAVTFINPPPIATTTRIAPQPETDSNHTDYGQGMSEWCSNCHTAFLASGGAGQHKHPAGNSSGLGADGINGNYNRYVATGNLTGVVATSYLALVPFERHESDPTQLDPTSTEGPADGTANVMCLSCHRAHASAFPNAGRWDFETALLVDSHPAPTDTGVTGSDVLYSYYNRDIATVFNPEQRSLCNKCHLKD